MRTEIKASNGMRTEIKASNGMRTEIKASNGMRTEIKALSALAGSLLMGAALLVAGGLSALLAPASASAAFGISSFDVSIANQDGTPATQAGSHPYELTTSFSFATTPGPNGQPMPDGNMKDVQIELPPGLIGNPNATPKCTVQDLDYGDCAGDTQLGVLSLTTAFGSTTLPIYNMLPPPGMPAQFGANALTIVDIFADVSLRTSGDYGLTVSLNNVTTILPLTGGSVTLWGVPADPSHDAERTCPGDTSPCSSGATLVPFLTNPTACSGPLTSTLRADSWQSPGDFLTANVVSHDAGGNPVGIAGCGRLLFNPSLKVAPGDTAADSPTGLSVDMHVAQTPEEPDALAAAAVKQAVIALPAGVSLDPSAADGLDACSLAQIGLDNANLPTCPDASSVGTVAIDTSLLSGPMEGSIYLAQPDFGGTPLNNPFGTTLAIYLTAEAHGILVKLPGRIDTDPNTGQLTMTVEGIPQVPFSDFKLSFDGGPRAVLATPSACGSYTTTSSLTPWSAPDSGPPSTLSDSFTIDSGCGGGFTPSFTAGTITPIAGASSPFTMTVAREDGTQYLSRIDVSLPPGLVARLSAVQLCGEPQASAGSCPAGSQIGTAIVAVGSGSHPFYLDGQVYATGAYEGAPFGLSIALSTVIGPFDFGTVVIRTKLLVDPNDLHLTIVSDPLPQILDGIPLRMRTVNVTVNRPGFIVNPTNCSPRVLTGTFGSTAGASVVLSAPFQVGGCSGLPFAAKLTASTQAQASSAGDGASLDVKLSGSAGTQANIRSVTVQLPGQLRPRLSTIEQACLATTLLTDPGACPQGSLVGSVTVRTPVLTSPLTGAIYLISHGGRTYPDLVAHVASAGVSVELEGALHISSNGSISTTFRGLPDVPISLLRLELASGPNSILGAIENLCAKALNAPYTITAQNGMRIAHTAIVAVDGCPKRSRERLHTQLALDRGHLGAHRLREREHRRARADHHGELVNQPILARVQEVTPI
jgi:hypothetical protein